jgi:hypothetical protein
LGLGCGSSGRTLASMKPLVQSSVTPKSFFLDVTSKLLILLNQNPKCLSFEYFVLQNRKCKALFALYFSLAIVTGKAIFHKSLIV